MHILNVYVKVFYIICIGFFLISYKVRPLKLFISDYYHPQIYYIIQSFLLKNKNGATENLPICYM